MKKQANVWSPCKECRSLRKRTLTQLHKAREQISLAVTADPHGSKWEGTLATYRNGSLIGDGVLTAFREADVALMRLLNELSRTSDFYCPHSEAQQNRAA